MSVHSKGSGIPVICRSCNKKSNRAYKDEIGFGPCGCGGELIKQRTFFDRKLDTIKKHMELER